MRFILPLGLLAPAAVLALLASLQSTYAQMYPPDSDQAAPSAELFAACGFCHGAQGQGRQRLDAPPLAGMQAWYLERQMHNFDTGIRGRHGDDLPGLQMSLITGMFRNDATIEALAAHIETLEPGAPPMTRGPQNLPEPLERPFNWESSYAELDADLPGDAQAGKLIYESNCVACHLDAAHGNELLGAPDLTLLADWYMARQLQYFRDSVRGAAPGDVFGSQMAVFSRLLPDDQAIADVIAYINTLEPLKP